jgi:hypothetical protein
MAMKVTERRFGLAAPTVAAALGALALVDLVASVPLSSLAIS